MYEPTDEILIELGGCLIGAAYEIFCDLKIESDFCVQCVGECAVFGGWNRLVWSAKYGFRLDKMYCTPHVIERWEEREKKTCA